MSRTYLIAGGFGAAAILVAAVCWYAGRSSASTDSQARSDDPEERLRAAERLGKAGDEKAVAELKRLARDKNEWVAIKAVQNLGKQRTAERRDLLAKMVSDKALSAAARGEAAATLGGFRDADPRLLTSTLSSDPDPKVRRGAAKGLVQMRKPATLKELVAALSDGDEKVRAYANAAIHNMIVRRFDIDPKRPPETQQEAIEKLKAYLKQCGVM